MKNFLSRRFLPILVLLFLLCLSFGGAGAAYADGEVSPAPADLWAKGWRYGRTRRS